MAKRVTLLSSDSRMVFQVKEWFRDLENDLRLETFSSLADFLAQFEKKKAPHAQDPPEVAPAESPPASDESSPKRAAVSANALHVLIVDLELIPQLPLKWMVETRKLLQQKGLSSPDHPTRFLALGFEDSHHRPEQLRHESVDDLVLKPLDRALFLQKVELLLADKPNVHPSFLFRQKTSMHIEAGKDAVIDEISEFAVSIRNPSPLMEGVYAALHSDVFGAMSDSRVIGRVYQNLRHPTHEGEYLVRFSYFGVNDRQLANIRRYVRSHHVPVKLKHDSASLKEKRGAFLGSEGPKRRVAVIDMNRDTTLNIQEALEGNFKDIQVAVFSSYSRFLGGLKRLMPSTEKSSAPAKPNAGSSSSSTEEARLQELQAESRPPAFPSGNRVTVILNAEDHALLRIEPTPKPKETVLGRTLDEWTERPDLWRSSVEPKDKEEFEEFLSYVRTGAKGHVVFRMTDVDGFVVYLEAEGRLEKTGEDDGLSLVRLDIREIERDAWYKIAESLNHDKGASAFQFEVIFVDGGVLPTEPAAWIEGVRELMQKAGVLKDGVPFPKIVILGDEGSRIRPDHFRLRGIDDFIFKPFDRKFILDKMQVLLPSLRRSENQEAQSFVPCEVPARIAKDVELLELSEYGLTIRHPTPFREHVFMRFFTPLFGDSSEGVIGRCTMSEPAGEGDQASYQIEFVFFGVSDELLKRIRTWIREDYVHKKEGNAG